MPFELVQKLLEDSLKPLLANWFSTTASRCEVDNSPDSTQYSVDLKVKLPKPETFFTSKVMGFENHLRKTGFLATKYNLSLTGFDPKTGFINFNFLTPVAAFDPTKTRQLSMKTNIAINASSRLVQTASPVEFESKTCSLVLVGVGRDTNGNHLIKFLTSNGERAKSIQTMSSPNDFKAARLVTTVADFKTLKFDEANAIIDEVCKYLKKYDPKTYSKIESYK